jgi:hypothetical protein
MSPDWTVRGYDLTGPTPKPKFGPEATAPPPAPGIDPIFAFAPNGRLLAQVIETGHVIVWNPAVGRREIEWHFPHDVRAVAFAPDSRHLATANSNGTVYILRLPRMAATPRRVSDIPDPAGERKR